LSDEEYGAATKNAETSPSKVANFRMGGVTRALLVVFCLLSAGISGKQTLWYLSHDPAFSDFRIFMTGVEMVRSGEGRDLYQFDAQERAQTRLYPATKIAGLLPFNHLAFELLYYWPVSRLAYRAAVIAWALINVGLVFLIGWLLTPYTRALREATGVAIALLLFAFYPVVFVLGEGQDSLIFLLLVVVSLRAMDAKRASLAGFVLALACFKLHLACSIAFFVFCLKGKWRALAGFAVGAITVFGVSMAMVGPSLMSDYLAMLRVQEGRTPWGFTPQYMPNLRGLLQWWLAPRVDMGTILPIIFVASVIVAGVAGWIVLRTRGEGEWSLIYSIAILTTVLISYHLHMQDLSIATLPMLVLLDRFIGGRIAGEWNKARDGSGRLTVPIVLSGVWGATLFTAVVCLYLFRVVAVVSPALLIHGCVLSLPVLLLWMVGLRTFSCGWIEAAHLQSFA
jgi:hypothetical protein